MEDPKEYAMRVPHIQQSYSYDCGLACSKMVLSFLGKDLGNFSKVCKTLEIEDSVWTIDLSFIFQMYDVKTRLTTITLGVDQTYAAKSFYKLSFSIDEARVNKRFTECSEKGVVVEQKSVEFQEIVDHLKNSGVIIILIDWSHLECLECNKSFCNALSSMKCCYRCSKSYQGHYILLTAIDMERQIIYYHDPALRKAICSCTFDVLETSRRQHGTDEDTLFIQVT